MAGPGAPHARYGVGRALAARGDGAGAVREFDAAVALYGEFGAAWYALGMALRNAGRLDEAKAALAKAQEFGARWPVVDDPLVAQVRALRDDASAHAERGLQLERQGDLTGAIQAYERAVAVDPAVVAPRVNLIALYGRQQDWSKAAAHYDALTSTGVMVPAEAHFNQGVCLAAQAKSTRRRPVSNRRVVESAVCQRMVQPWPDCGNAWTHRRGRDAIPVRGRTGAGRCQRATQPRTHADCTTEAC